MILPEIQIAEPIVKHYECGDNVDLIPYVCPGGYLTVGWGHLTKSNAPITYAQAIRYLQSDLATSYNQLLAYTKAEAIYAMQSYQRASLISFVFNLGIGNYQVSTLRRCVNRQDWQGVVGEFPKWRKAGGHVLGGLVKRRATEALLFDTGEIRFYNNVADIEDRYKVQ